MASRQWLAPVEHNDTAAAISSDAQCSGTTHSRLHADPSNGPQACVMAYQMSHVLATI